MTARALWPLVPAAVGLAALASCAPQRPPAAPPAGPAPDAGASPAPDAADEPEPQPCSGPPRLESPAEIEAPCAQPEYLDHPTCHGSIRVVVRNCTSETIFFDGSAYRASDTPYPSYWSTAWIAPSYDPSGDPPRSSEVPLEPQGSMTRRIGVRRFMETPGEAEFLDYQVELVVMFHTSELEPIVVGATVRVHPIRPSP